MSYDINTDKFDNKFEFTGSPVSILDIAISTEVLFMVGDKIGNFVNQIFMLYFACSFLLLIALAIFHSSLFK